MVDSIEPLPADATPQQVFDRLGEATLQGIEGLLHVEGGAAHVDRFLKKNGVSRALFDAVRDDLVPLLAASQDPRPNGRAHDCCD